MRNLVTGFLLLFAFVPALPGWTDKGCASDLKTGRRSYTVELPRDTSSGCALCNRVTVGHYDVKIPPQPMPGTIASFNDWQNLYIIGGFVAQGLFGNDNCTSHKDGAVINATTIGNGTLRTGPGAPSVPPDGPIQALEYLFTGTVVDTGAGYQATIMLETAISRETVASASFNLAYGFSSSDLNTQATAAAAAAAIGPLDTTLANYEQKKRDTNTTVALGEKGLPGAPNGLSISMGADTLKPGESTPVYVQLMDCDGTPLANREVMLQAFNDPDLGPFPGPTGGTVAPGQVYTDANGNATATFTADSSIGTIATIPGASVYYRPPGNKLAFVATGTVSVQPTPIWLIKVDFDSEDTINQDQQQVDVLGQVQQQSEQQTRQIQYHFTFACDESFGCGYNSVYAGLFGDGPGNYSARTVVPVQIGSASGLVNWEDAKRSYFTNFSYGANNQPQWDETIFLQHNSYHGSGFSSGSGGTEVDLSMGELSVSGMTDVTQTFSENDFSYGGWTDTGWTKATQMGDGMSCVVSDPGTTVIMDKPGGPLTITCTQSSNHNYPDENRYEHISSTLFLTMRRLAAPGS